MIYEHLANLNDDRADACLVGFILKNTLSDYGLVSRGICKVNEQHLLSEITERPRIFSKSQGGAYFEENGQKIDLTGEEIVFMNLMGFTSKVFAMMSEMFIDFLKREGSEPGSEFYIPSVLDHLRMSGLRVPVLMSSEQWFGVTYRDDKPIAKANLERLVKAGVYPENLWQ